MKTKFIRFFARIRRYFKYLKIRKLAKNKKYTHLCIGAPIHGNLGDHQITVSTQEFLKKNGIKFIEISMFDYFNMRNLKFNNIKVVCLQGGGNMGDVYHLDIQIRDDVVRRFPDKKIVVFPQTFYCENKTETSEAFVTKKIFENHKNLVICAREQKSFEEMKRFFEKNKVILVPDIVLSSNYTNKSKTERKGVLFVLRNDREKVVSQNTINKIKKTVFDMGYRVTQTDTVLKYLPYEIFRKKELDKIFKKIASAEFVITDRLHGMIFAAITNTPCIVTSNYNFKIEESYNKWLTNCKHIKFVQSLEQVDLMQAIQEVLSEKPNWVVPDKEFEKLKKEI